MPVRTKISLLAVLSLMPGLGCDKIVALINDGAQAAANEAGGGLTGGPKTDDDRLGEKLQAYIDCINGPATNISDSGKRYFDWIDDPKVGPTGKETSVYGLYEIRDTKPCLDGIAKAAELEPDDTDLEAAAKACGQPKLVANWLMGEVSRRLNAEDRLIEASPVSAAQLAAMIVRIADGTISNNGAKQVFDALWTGQGSEVDAVIEAKGLKQMSDSGELERIIDEVLAANAKSVEEYRAGKDKAFNALVGQAMKATKGKANPAQVNELLKKKLG